ncbi:MAG TPA: ABC transporter ATP-binding protein, partial [Candidatus Dormibacteraeota bacterium]|nr:ABC transporter ATP-binding protein [Candidatus Dormibacteraeota bacterium]
ALFPHISVERNLAYGLAGWRQSDREARIAELVDWLGLGGLEHRLPGELSGGQKQRVALGRAVASRPSLLLLDEPLAALDLPTRSRLRNELRQLLKQVDAATVLVTHDRSDALALADHVVVIDNGKVLQQGPPATVFDRPETHAVAGIVSIETIQPGIIVESGDLTTVTVGAQKLVAAKTALSPGAKSVFVCIRAEDVLLVKGEPPKTSSRNSLPSIVRDLIAEGPMMRVELDCGFPLKALLTRQACNELGLQKGSQLLALIKAPNVHLVERAWPTDR